MGTTDGGSPTNTDEHTRTSGCLIMRLSTTHLTNSLNLNTIPSVYIKKYLFKILSRIVDNYYWQDSQHKPPHYG